LPAGVAERRGEPARNPQQRRLTCQNRRLLDETFHISEMLRKFNALVVRNYPLTQIKQREAGQIRLFDEAALQKLPFQHV
jgi:hypothetical protein